MYLVSQSNPTVSIDGHTFAIEKGEKILTEHSHSYTIDSFAELAASAQFKLEKWWTDDNNWFAVCYLSRQ